MTYEIQTKGKTVTTVHNEASTWIGFSTEESPSKVSIFGTEYFLNCISIDSVWEQGKRVPDVSAKISYVTIRKTGKAGESYNTRQFSIEDIGKYVVGQDEVIKAVFKQHEETVQGIIQGKEAA
jgi:hypothetical protein